MKFPSGSIVRYVGGDNSQDFRAIRGIDLVVEFYSNALPNRSMVVVRDARGPRTVDSTMYVIEDKWLCSIHNLSPKSRRVLPEWM